MKKTNKIICIACLCTILASVTGCSNISQNNESISSTDSQVSVQDNDMNSKISDVSDTDNDADSSVASDSTSITDSGDSKTRIIPENENTTFDLPADKAYNTSLKPNVPDDVNFQVELTYTEDFSTDNPRVVATEILPLTATTTYADICNLSNFSLVTVDGEMSIEENRHGHFDYYGIMHTTTNSPATYTIGTDTFTIKPTLNLELIQNNQIISDTSTLVSTNDNIRVKAISAKSVAYNSSIEDQEYSTPVMLSFNVSLPEQDPSQYKVGMSWSSAFQSLKKQGIIPSDFKTEDFYIGNAKDYLILKNTDYTLVFSKEGNIVGGISLIKN